MHIPEKRPLISLTPKPLIWAIVTIALLTWAWFKLQDSAGKPIVSYDDLMIATVEKGDLIREVRAPGTLVPVELSYLSATSEGRIQSIAVEPGDTVEAGTLVMTMDNPQLSLAVDAAKYDLQVQQAAYLALEKRLQQELLGQRIRVADFKSRYAMAKQRKNAFQRLLNTGAVSEISYNEAILLAQQLKEQHQLEIERLHSLPGLGNAELAVARARADKARRQLARQQERLDGLLVRATVPGILQEIRMKPGQQVTRGILLARIAGQDDFKAALQIPQAQAKDVVKGQGVVISAGGKQAGGIVKRINPAVKQGTVTVDVYFTGATLEGARPDLSINGVIELQRLANVLKVQRPVFSRENATAEVFVVDPDRSLAVRKSVAFGQGSVDTIEVLSALNVGDKVVVSSTADYADLTEFRLPHASHYQ